MMVVMVLIVIVFLRVLIVLSCVPIVRGFREARPRIPDQTVFAAGHLSGAVSAQIAQLLFLLLFQAATFIGFPAMGQSTVRQVVLLTVFCVVNLLIKAALQLFAGIAGPMRWARRKDRRERQEGTDHDRARGPMLSHTECLLDTQIFHRSFRSATSFV